MPKKSYEQSTADAFDAARKKSLGLTPGMAPGGDPDKARKDREKQRDKATEPQQGAGDYINTFQVARLKDQGLIDDATAERLAGVARAPTLQDIQQRLEEKRQEVNVGIGTPYMVPQPPTGVTIGTPYEVPSPQPQVTIGTPYQVPNPPQMNVGIGTPQILPDDEEQRRQLMLAMMQRGAGGV